MARIRHIAIATRDLEGTKKFYIDGLGLKEVGKINTPTSEGCYLTDGHINFAILRFKYDEPAKTEGTLRYTGIHHFGFQCDDLEQQQKQIEKAGGKFFFDLGDPDDDDFERKFRDPNGIIFDINWKGWSMTAGKVRAKSAAARRKVGKKTGKPVKAAKKVKTNKRK